MFKEKLLGFIAGMSEGTCERILTAVLDRLMTNERMICINKEFEEADHPRAKDGKFMVKTGSGSVVDADDLDELRKQARESRDAFNAAERLETRFTGVDGYRKPLLGGHSPKYYERKGNLEVDRINLKGAKDRAELRKKNTKLAKEYRDNDELIDTMQEYYGNGDFKKLKFPDTPEGKSDKKKYSKLLRRQKELDKRIDWSWVEDEEPEAGEE